MNKYRRALFSLLLTTPLFIFAAKPSSQKIVRSFHSDHCTLWPDAAFDFDWSKCCYHHDLYYWSGGSSGERKRADQELKSCVKNNSNHVNAAIMFWGVQLGSLSPFKLKSQQWGNAWGNDVRKNPLQKNEIEQLRKSLFLNLPPDMSHSDIDTFIQNLKKRLQQDVETAKSSFSEQP